MCKKKGIENIPSRRDVIQEGTPSQVNLKPIPQHKNIIKIYNVEMRRIVGKYAEIELK